MALMDYCLSLIFYNEFKGMPTCQRKRCTFVNLRLYKIRMIPLITSIKPSKMVNTPTSSISEEEEEEEEEVPFDERPYGFHSRVESLLKELDDTPRAQPLVVLHFECFEDCNGDVVGGEEEPEAACEIDASHQDADVHTQQLNLAPELALHSMISFTHKRLCQLELCSTDVPFLCDNTLSGNGGGALVSAPFMMFPEQSTVIVTRDGPDGNYTISSRGPLVGGIMAHLFGIQGSTNGKRVKIEGYAFRDSIPPYLACRPIPLDAAEPT